MHKRAPVLLRLLLTVSLLGGASGCCPDPVSASADSLALSDGGASLTARLSTIEREVFERSCVADCHGAISPAMGLRLAAGYAHGDLVNQKSQQIASQLRVKPGYPEQSYLVKKLTGQGIVGDQMPRLAPLAEESIALIRTWIERGAPHD